ncbi:exodeoxyribonuclease V subunit beta [Endozoicomonas ascidiicola]|uniref:exodeoxyribonuclease V subunit beta n=1 Tax=Endozoicomonas ascidiicola TaxID=1698521 RepID=UPI000A74BA0E|nr:exodeoxyribonuclease V subunit beta [Endozoicomonas ascidiicola]
MSDTNITTHDQSPEALNPLALPLHGSRLIEASAGTGKTYTIANLYLRILLGHGSEHSKHTTPLNVDQILVVTFTEAATGELRDRVRARIHKTREDFIAGRSSDGFIQQLIDDMGSGEHSLEHCQALLLAAEQQMDEAAIFTIHGFCQRMLKQHAFESGTLFTSELITDTESMLQLCAADFWRRSFYPLEKPLVTLIRSIWKTPEDLLNHLRGWIGRSELMLMGNGVPETLADLHQNFLAPALEIKQLWQDDQGKLADMIQSCGMGKRAKPLTRIDDVTEFVNSGELLPKLGSSNDGWEIYSTEILEKGLTKSGTMPVHPVFEKIDAFVAQPLSIKEALKAFITREALTQIKAQFSQLKASRHQLSFDDLLTNLAGALFSEDTADGGELLAQAIRSQYRIAMIDEFQDTDPLQYRIFNKIYRDAGDPDVGLFMIGDPKQAIYAFRGADIFTYMQARKQVHQHYTLDTNWRSSDTMVSAANAVFQQADSPFIYNDSIPFDPVHPSPGASNKRLLFNGQPLPAMTLWLQKSFDGSTVNSESYLDTMAASTATEINRLLTAADQDQCLVSNGDKQAPLQPGDIAVLVRSRNHGQKIKDALAAQNIPSIYLSNQDSVFNSEVATDLEKILQACLHPTSERMLKAALATRLFHLNAETLNALNVDEQSWESAVDEFTRYGELWLQRGVLPMIRQMIFKRKIAERLLTFTNGERRLTDLLHLGELLAAASLEQQGASALIRWFSEQVTRPNQNADNQQLHLESERNLVKIITIHKSKGLEYNVVFIPFPCHLRKGDSPLFHDEKTNETILSLTPNDDASQLAEKERLAEDLRLLYVALTRSVYCCYLGMAAYKSGRASKDGKTDLHQTAVGYLLNGGDDIFAPELPQLLSNLSNQCENQQIVVAEPLSAELPIYTPVVSQDLTLSAREFKGNIQRNWWTTSYSALSRHSSSKESVSQNNLPTSVDAANEVAGFDSETRGEQHNLAETEVEVTPDPLSLFCFPKGAQPGTFMHSLFEDLDMQRLRSAEGDAYLDQFVLEALIRDGYEEVWLPAIRGMLQNCLNAALDGDSMKLKELSDTSRRVEMEFFLPIEHLDPNQLNQLIKHHDPLSAKAGNLEFHTMKGMLKGFIDLTFEYQGRWYVLDYKSNFLGSTVDAYSQEAMETVMVDHRYDLQYQLYSLALHRLLQQRVHDYQYEQHFGGVIYLFLRGVQVNDNHRYGIFSHKPTFELVDSLDALFKGNFKGEFKGELNNTGPEELFSC